MVEKNEVERLEAFLLEQYPKAEKSSIAALRDKLVDIINDFDAPIVRINDRVIEFEFKEGIKYSRLLNVLNEIVFFVEYNEKNVKRLFHFTVHECSVLNIFLWLRREGGRYLDDRELEKLEEAGKIYDLCWIDEE